MKALLSFGALFLSGILLQLGTGALGPLDALAGSAQGFSQAEVGLLGSAHFAGFLLGCWLAPRFMGSVGHARAFAAFAAIAAIGTLAHTLFSHPGVWAFLRIFAGVSIAGTFTVIESWLQASASNANRGRLLGAYRLFDSSASVGAQVLISVLDPTSYMSYNILAILCCLCLLPLALTKARAPIVPKAPRLRLYRVMRLSPLGTVGIMVTGLTASSFRMIGPIYGSQQGLSNDQIGLFLAAGILGGALAQVPVGWLADRFDRRRVMMAVSAASCAGCAMLVGLGGAANAQALYIGAMLFGASAFPLYSVTAAHINDYARPEDIIETNAAILTLYSLGAIVSPIAAASLMDYFSSEALFIYIACAHLVLLLFAVYRSFVRPSVSERQPFRLLTRTSLLFSRFLSDTDSQTDKTQQK